MIDPIYEIKESAFLSNSPYLEKQFLVYYPRQRLVEDVKDSNYKVPRSVRDYILELVSKDPERKKFFLRHALLRVDYRVDVYSNLFVSDKHDDVVDACAYAMAIQNLKTYGIPFEGGKDMHKSTQEIAFEKAAADIKAEAEKKTREIATEAEQNIEAARKLADLDILRERTQDEANEHWMFYSALVGAGFSEEQAMSILLKKI